MKKSVIVLILLGIVLAAIFLRGNGIGYLIFDSSGGLTADSSVVGLWHMNGNAVDSSGKGNDGIINGGVDCNVQGKFGKGCGFDGVDDYISITNPIFNSMG